MTNDLDNKTLYRVHYYIRPPNQQDDVWKTERTSKLVFAETRRNAKDWVKRQTPYFDSFAFNHVHTPEGAVGVVDYDIADMEILRLMDAIQS